MSGTPPADPHGSGPVPPAQHLTYPYREGANMTESRGCSEQIEAHLGPAQLLQWNPVRVGQSAWPVAPNTAFPFPWPGLASSSPIRYLTRIDPP